LLHVIADNDTRKVTVDKFQTSQSGGAAFKNAVIDWADGAKTTPVSNVVGQSHTYATDGTYKITATAHFTVNGAGDVTAPVTETCTQVVTFSSTPVTPPTTPPVLPNTGAGNVIGIVLGAIAAGTIAGRLFLSRKLARR
jgi:LPXTG-motif cell wall-anchored protein